jgi:hypothetical protein
VKPTTSNTQGPALVQGPRRLALGVLGVAWCVLVAAGFLALSDYSARPGVASAAPGHWPNQTKLHGPEKGSRLLLFVHPYCPCSRSTLDSVDHVLARHGSRIDATLILTGGVEIDPGAQDWFDQWCQRRKVALVHDVQRIESARFGVKTSGHVLLYDETGARRFSGGISAGRGHTGDNPGLQSLMAAMEGATPVLERGEDFPVYGCAIWERSH